MLAQGAARPVSHVLGVAPECVVLCPFGVRRDLFLLLLIAGLAFGVRTYPAWNGVFTVRGGLNGPRALDAVRDLNGDAKRLVATPSFFDRAGGCRRRPRP